MSDNIRVKLPDNSVKEVPKGTTALDIANSISPRLAQAAIAAQIRPMSNGNEPKLVDLTRPLESDAELRILTERDPEALKVFRHSAAHVMATAVLELFPETKLGHGPATRFGFFYDFYRETPFTPDDLEAIEKKMAEVGRAGHASRANSRARRVWKNSRQEGDFMKVHFIEKFTKPGEEISLYRNGNFTDFCRGPHVPSTGRVKAFKVLSLAGAYWLGDEKNPAAAAHLWDGVLLAERSGRALQAAGRGKKRDHRVLGKQLDLFSIQELAGPGLIFWHPKGGMIRKMMEDWMRDECISRADIRWSSRRT